MYSARTVITSCLSTLLVCVASGGSGALAAGVCACDADVDNSGAVNIVDWACIQDCKAGSCGCCVNSCDINCDGVVDDRDAGDDAFNEESMWRCQFIGFPAESCCGSCCQVIPGVCTDDVIESDCGGAGLAWFQGLRCAEVSCTTEPTGACCDLNLGTCDEGLLEADCAAVDELWVEGLACAAANCPVPPSGACCNEGNGHCQDGLFEALCTGPDRFWTEAAACSAISCAVPPQEPCPCQGEVTGAAPVNVLDVVAVLECVADDCSGCAASCDTDCSTYVDYVDMGVVACQFVGQTDCCNKPSGACVGAQALPACIITLEAGCDVVQGTYLGDGVACSGPPVGACCHFALGTCDDEVIEADCTAVGDLWVAGMDCDGASCPAPPPGACCQLSLGTCAEEVIEADCAAVDELWVEGLACAAANCPVPPSGACCNENNGHCQDDVFEALCTGPGRFWTEATACSAITCAVPPQEPCPCQGEVTGAAPVNILDVVAVLECVADDCSGCAASCDTDCSTYVDYIDMGVVACHFVGQSDCCNKPSGACVGAQALPACVITLEAGCDVLQGTYIGDGSDCASASGSVPTVSEWGAMILALLLCTVATLIIDHRRRGRVA